MVEMKCCSKCNKSLPVTTEYFSKSNNAKGGYYTICKDCKRIKYAEWYADNKKKRRSSARNWYINNRERVNQATTDRRRLNPEKARESRKRYYETHKDEIKAKEHKRFSENKERSALLHRIWRKSHKEYSAIWARRYRARKFSAEGSHSIKDVSLILKNQSYKCWWCGKSVKSKKYHVDHIIPLSKGGSDNAANLCIACPECNMSKGSKTSQEYAGRLF